MYTIAKIHDRGHRDGRIGGNGSASYAISMAKAIEMREFEEAMRSLVIAVEGLLAIFAVTIFVYV